MILLYYITIISSSANNSLLLLYENLLSGCDSKCSTLSATYTLQNITKSDLKIHKKYIAVS